MRQLLDELGITLGYLMAGLFGAFIFKPKVQVGWGEFSVRVLSGAVSANYITPVVVSLSPALEKASFGIAFLVGYGGVHIADLLLEFVKRKLTEL